MRGPLQCTFACELQISYGSAVIPALIKMHRQLSRDLYRPLAIASLFSFADPAVPLLAPPDGHPFVPEVLIHGVAKPVACRHRPVRPFADTRPAEKLLTPGQLLTVFLYLSDVSCYRGGRRGGRELRPCETGGLQQPSVFGLSRALCAAKSFRKVSGTSIEITARQPTMQGPLPLPAPAAPGSPAPPPH